MVTPDALAFAEGSFSAFRLPDVPPVTPAACVAAPGHVTEAEWLSRIDHSFQQLDEFQRRILLLRSSCNLSYAEIAHELQLGVETVKATLAKARETLRSLLAQDCPEFGQPAVSSPA